MWYICVFFILYSFVFTTNIVEPNQSIKIKKSNLFTCSSYFEGYTNYYYKTKSADITAEITL